MMMIYTDLKEVLGNTHSDPGMQRHSLQNTCTCIITCTCCPNLTSPSFQVESALGLAAAKLAFSGDLDPYDLAKAPSSCLYDALL